MRCRKGLRLFSDTPTTKSQVGEVVFASGEGLPGQVAGADAAAGGAYKLLFSNAAGRPSWVDRASGLRAPPGRPVVDAQDLDDLEASRGVRRFPHFEQKSAVFDGVLVDVSANPSRDSQHGCQRPTKSQGFATPEASVNYRDLYVGAAGTPSWTKRPTRAKGSVSDRLRHKLALQSRRLMTRINKEWKVGRTDASTVRRQEEDRGIRGSPCPSQRGRPPRGVGQAAAIASRSCQWMTPLPTPSRPDL